MGSRFLQVPPLFDTTSQTFSCRSVSHLVLSCPSELFRSIFTVLLYFRNSSPKRVSASPPASCSPFLSSPGSNYTPKVGSPLMFPGTYHRWFFSSLSLFMLFFPPPATTSLFSRVSFVANFAFLEDRSPSLSFEFPVFLALPSSCFSSFYICWFLGSF